MENVSIGTYSDPFGLSAVVSRTVFGHSAPTAHVFIFMPAAYTLELHSASFVALDLNKSVVQIETCKCDVNIFLSAILSMPSALEREL